MEYSNLFVVLMGIGTVFIGLICIIVLVTIMSSIIRKLDKGKNAISSQTANSAGNAAISDASSGTGSQAGCVASAGKITPELVAAISAVIAEQMGTDVSAIRILSIKTV